MTLRGILLFFLLLGGMLAPEIATARHIIGGEITYECLGPGANSSLNRYRFTMKIYRDCDPSYNGAELDPNAQISIFRGTYLNPEPGPFQKFTVPIMPIEKLIPDTPRCVNNIPNVCVQQGTYVFIRELPISLDKSYFIVYQRCCRNGTISNLINPGDLGATYMVEITPTAQQLCNNSPVFQNFPPIIICKDFSLEFDHSATDADGDQLVYSFCAPWKGGGNDTSPGGITLCTGAMPSPPCAPPFFDVPFVVPTYSPTNPIGGAPQVTINAVTGFISGRPNKLGQFVVGVCVQEYRNGVLLSTVKREFQFNVTNCDPQVVADVFEDSITGPKRYYIESCGDRVITLKNESKQRANVDRFIWTFDFNNGTIFQDSTSWDPLTIVFPDTGLYQGTLYLNPGEYCGDTAFITIRIFPTVRADFSYIYDTCVAGPVVFTDQSSGDGIVNKWNWNFGVPGGTSVLQNPDYLYPIPGNHPVRLTVTDQNGCKDDTLQVINWFPVPPVIIIKPNSFLGCTPANIFFDNLSTPIDETYDIVWDFGDGGTLSGTISPTHVYTEPGIYSVSVKITSPIGCFTSSTFDNLIRVEPSPTADFSCDPDTLLSIFNNTVKFTDLSQGAIYWNWQFGRYSTTTQQNPIFTFPDTGKVKIRLVVTHPRGCQDSISKILDIRPEIRWFMPNAFTPNGDGNNDGFLGKGSLLGVTDFNMTIWNRWGEQVFETTDPTEEWNGRQKNTGGVSPAGVYVYLVTFTEPRGERLKFKGFATIVR